MIKVPDLCLKEELQIINRFVHVRFVCKETLTYCKYLKLNKSSTRKIFKKVQNNFVKNPVLSFENCKVLGLGLDISSLKQYIDLLILEQFGDTVIQIE